MASERTVTVHVNENGQRLNLVEIEARLLQIAAEKSSLNVELAILVLEEETLLVQKHKIEKPFVYKDGNNMPSTLDRLKH